MKMTLPSQVSL